MKADHEVPKPFPVRHLEDRGWEVLIATEKLWLPCYTEHDARVIARGPLLEYESLERTRTGETFANELNELADMLAKYRIGFGSRFFRQRAEVARQEE